MKILLIADVHNRPKAKQKAHNKTLEGIKKAISETACDLIVFLGDTVHGPDFSDCSNYEKYLREVLDLTENTPFAFIFGNHDDECNITKEQILKIVKSYPNNLTQGKNYTLNLMDECLLFIDSGSYFEGEESYYDIVKQDTISWALNEIKNKKAILFQHIIMPDIVELIKKSLIYKPNSKFSGGKWIRFNSNVKYTGNLRENPCPPDINTGEFEQLAPFLKGAVFGHDHVNDFELFLKNVKFIQCAGSGYNSYDKHLKSSVKLLDTETMQTQQIFI